MKQKNKLLQLLGVGAMLLFSSVSAVAQGNVVVGAQMDSAAIMMGEQTIIRLELSQDQGATVQQPVLNQQDTLVIGVEVLEVSRPDTVDLKNNRIQVNREVLITSFDPGLYYLPPFRYVAGNDTVETQPLSLKVVAVPVDSAQITIANIDSIAFNDVKPIEAPRFVLWDYFPKWLPWALLVAALIALGIFIYLRYFKKKGVSEVGEQKVQIPPYDLAIQELTRLKESKLWQQGQEKLYYTELTDILREYLDGRFHINAMEMTSTQIINALRMNEETRAVNQQLREILAMADFVKFAKMRPLPDDNEQVMRYAETFVNETKPVEKAPEEVEQSPENKNSKTKG